MKVIVYNLKSLDDTIYDLKKITSKENRSKRKGF